MKSPSFLAGNSLACIALLAAALPPFSALAQAVPGKPVAKSYTRPYGCSVKYAE